MLEPDLQVFHLLLDGGCDQVAHRSHRSGCEGAAVRAAADEVGQATVGQALNHRIGLPIQLVVAHGGVAGSQRDPTDVGTDKHIDLILGDELLDGCDSLLRIGDVAAHEFNLAAVDAARCIDLFHGELVTACHLIAVERHRAAVRVERANLYGRLLRGRERRPYGGTCQHRYTGQFLECFHVCLLG